MENAMNESITLAQLIYDCHAAKIALLLVNKGRQALYY